MMARKKAEVVEELEEVIEDIEDLVEELEGDIEAEEATSSGEMLTAKQAASLLGTDGRTFRKFLRKKFGTIGQGKRWEVDPDDVEALKAEFAAFSSGGTRGEGKATKGKGKKKAEVVEDAPDMEELDDDELEEIEAFSDEDFEDLDFDDD